VNDAAAYLRALRRALPIGSRRRLVAEVREHFASAVTAEAERGVSRAEAERSTAERLGPAEALANQLLSDLRSGRLGLRGRLAAATTAPRLLALTAVIAIAAAAGGLSLGRRSSPPPPAAKLTVSPTVVLDPATGEARPVLLTLRAVVYGTGYHAKAPGYLPVKAIHP
jgi:hypothetical protein